MSQTITAVYADGVLRPLVPLQLAEQTRVEVVIKRINGAPADGAAERPLNNQPGAEPIPLPPPASAEERARIHQALVTAGLVIERPPLPPPDPPLTEEERARLGQLFATGKPLSEIIIEEREDRF